MKEEIRLYHFLNIPFRHRSFHNSISLKLAFRNQSTVNYSCCSLHRCTRFQFIYKNSEKLKISRYFFLGLQFRLAIYRCLFTRNLQKCAIRLIFSVLYEIFMDYIWRHKSFLPYFKTFKSNYTLECTVFVPKLFVRSIGI